MIAFVIPIEPRAGGNNKRIVRKKDGTPFLLNTDKQAGWKTEVRLLSQRFAPSTPLDGPIEFTADFYFSRPESIPKRRGTGALPKVTRPDLDNCEKLLLDALSAFWVDDARITSKMTRKFVCAIGQRPRIEVTIKPLEGTT